MAASASDAHPYPIYNARFRVIFPLLDADGDLVTGASTPDSELSQDCGTFADATNEMTEIATGSGLYYLDLIAGELDTKSTAIIAKSATAGMKTTPIVLYPVRLPVIRTGTAQAGAAGTITLDSGASAIDDYYVGCYVNITNNSPANAQGQARKVTAYNGSTKVATVEGTYGTNPSSASTFEILATEDWIFRFGDTRAFAGVAATASGGRPEVNATTVADSAGVTTLLSRLSALRAGYLDNLSAGAVALEASLQGLITTIGASAAGVATAVWAAGTRTLSAFGFAVTVDTNNDKTGYGLADGAITSAKVADGFLTVAKLGAGFFDGVWAVASRTLTSFGTLVANMADAVWDETLADHLTAGSTGAGLNSAGSAGDPWATALPGAYGPGTAGKILGDNLNATVSSRASQTSVDDVPTNAELATALAGADDAVLSAISGLNNLSQAQAQTAAAAALTAYDAPTSAEMDARTLPAANYATASNLATVAGFVDTEIQAIINAIAALNNISLADVRTQLAAELDAVVPDSVPADGTRPSMRQSAYMGTQFLLERSVTGVTMTVKKPDGVTTLFTLTLGDATNPTSITRAS